jgi:hypothetical protein
VRRPRVLIGGLPYFGHMLAGLLAVNGWEMRYLESPRYRPSDWMHAARAIAWADLVYLIGGQIQRGSRPDWLSRLGRPLVMHWVGSDVSFARSVVEKGLVSDRLTSGPAHWVEVPWTGAELAQIGIRAEVVPLTSARLPIIMAPMPEQFTVLTYLPPDRPEFYGSADILRLAESLPDVHFLVAGSAGMQQATPSNVRFLGWREDMAPVYAASSVLLRQPDHDGLSFMVLEALAAGRYAIWNRVLQGATHAATYDEALVALTSLRDQHRAGALRANEAGRDEVARSYSVDRVRSEILGRFESILGDLSP